MPCGPRRRTPAARCPDRTAGAPACEPSCRRRPTMQVTGVNAPGASWSGSVRPGGIRPVEQAAPCPGSCRHEAILQLQCYCARGERAHWADGEHVGVRASGFWVDQWPGRLEVRQAPARNTARRHPIVRVASAHRSTPNPCWDTRGHGTIRYAQPSCRLPVQRPCRSPSAHAACDRRRVAGVDGDVKTGWADGGRPGQGSRAAVETPSQRPQIGPFTADSAHAGAADMLRVGMGTTTRGA